MLETQLTPSALNADPDLQASPRPINTDISVTNSVTHINEDVKIDLEDAPAPESMSTVEQPQSIDQQVLAKLKAMHSTYKERNKALESQIQTMQIMQPSTEVLDELVEQHFHKFKEKLDGHVSSMLQSMQRAQEGWTLMIGAFGELREHFESGKNKN